MELRLDSNLNEYLEKTSRYLEADGLMHSLIYGIALRYQELGKPMSLMASLISQNGKIHATGIQTEANRALLLSNANAQDAALFSELLHAQDVKIPEANGPIPAIDSFVERSCALRGSRTKLITNLRLFQLHELANPKATVGFPRIANSGDRDLVYAWLRDFQDEAIPNDPILSREDLYKSVDAGLKAEQFFVWELNGQVVSLVGSRRETKAEKWIGPVYTPPSLRGAGYASVLTAYVTGKILELGKKAVLFADLANPTSNSIYQKIGYQAVGDFKHISFMN